MAKRHTKQAASPAGERESPRFVLDCSVALSWFFADEPSDYADAVAAALAAASAVAPPLWQVEVANCLLVGERRKRCTEAQATAFLKRLDGLPIFVAALSSQGSRDVVAIGRRHGLSAYDACYLELAMRRSLPLATLDAKLLAAAKAAGVAEFEP
jgi:predicted nucleic acid-binding protein